MRSKDTKCEGWDTIVQRKLSGQRKTPQGKGG